MPPLRCGRKRIVLAFRLEILLLLVRKSPNMAKKKGAMFDVVSIITADCNQGVDFR